MTRAKLVAVVGQMSLEVRAYGCQFKRPRRQESARARALRWFLQELDDHLDEIVLDRRQEAQDSIDRKILAQRVGRPYWFKYRHARSREEPLLWVADVVAGAVAAEWTGGPPYLQGLAEVVSACECE